MADAMADLGMVAAGLSSKETVAVSVPIDNLDT